MAARLHREDAELDPDGMSERGGASITGYIRADVAPHLCHGLLANPWFREPLAEHGLTSDPWHSEAVAIRGAIPTEPCYSPAPLRWLKRRT